MIRSLIAPTPADSLEALVAADGATGGFIKDSEAGNLPATSTNDDAATGKLGEFVESRSTAAAPTNCTISNASPAVITDVAHGLDAGSVVNFTTTGGLPTGLSTGTNYYVLSTGLTDDTFQVAATPFGTAINTSSAGSGTHSYEPEAIVSSGVVFNFGGLWLTPGDWMVSGTGGFLPAGTTTVSRVYAGASLTSATFGEDPGSYTQLRASLTTGGTQMLAIPPQRFSLDTASAVCAVGLAAFGVSTMGAYCALRAWRMR